FPTSAGSIRPCCLGEQLPGGTRGREERGRRRCEEMTVCTSPVGLGSVGPCCQVPVSGGDLLFAFVAEGADSPHDAGRSNMTQNGADCDVVRLMAGDPLDFSAGHSLDEP